MKTATDILRAHVTERRLRSAPRSANLDGEQGAVSRMGEDAWVTSCQLVAGVDETTLRLLEVYFCESNGEVWERVLVEVQGKETELRDVKAPVRLTLVEAASRLGLLLNFKQARELLRDAVSRVDERLVARAGREERP